MGKTVVDPVMVAKSGHRLLREDAQHALKELLLPLAMVVTPNVPEAEVLSGATISKLEDIRQAAAVIHSLGPRYVLVKGGHLPGKAVDILYDGKTFVEFTASRIDTPNTHGTGCTYSAAITALLARGKTLVEAVREAKEFISRAIAGAPGIGHGHGPVGHTA